MFTKGHQLWKNRLKKKEPVEVDTTPMGEMLTEEPVSPPQVEYLNDEVILNVRIKLSPGDFTYLETVCEGRSTTYEDTIQEAVKYMVENGIL